MPVMELILPMVYNILIWAVYRDNKSQIHGGYLVREDGSLIREVSLTGDGTVPYGLLTNKARAIGMSQLDALDFGKYQVTLVHGRRLHFAAVSSLRPSKSMLRKIQRAVMGLEEADFDDLRNEVTDRKNRDLLRKFEEDLEDIGKRA